MLALKEKIACPDCGAIMDLFEVEETSKLASNRRHCPYEFYGIGIHTKDKEITGEHPIFPRAAERVRA